MINGIHVSPDYTSEVADLAHDFFTRLDSKHWHGFSTGVVRPGYSREETEAMDIAAAIAHSLGQDVYEDLAGNRIFLTEGWDKSLPVILSGSHLDAVPRGGRYDGPAGVATSLAATKMLHDAHFTPQRGFGTVIFRNEESPWFGDFAVGSKFATGVLSLEFLARTRSDNGKRLEQLMTEEKIDARTVTMAATIAMPSLPLSDIHSFLETHIEQGPLLAEAGHDIGLVTHIRGNVRFQKEARVVFRGVAGHTGATPQDRRIDAVLGQAEFLNKLEAFTKHLNGQGLDVVMAPTNMSVVNPNGTTIAAEAYSELDIRSIDQDVLETMKKHVLMSSQQVAQERGGHAEIAENRIVTNKPAVMSQQVLETLEHLALKGDVRFKRMVSGAGHDAGIMAAAGIESAMLFIAHGNNGYSHRPDEMLGLYDNDAPCAPGSNFAKAATLTAQYIVDRCGFAVERGQGDGFSRNLTQKLHARKLRL